MSLQEQDLISPFKTNTQFTSKMYHKEVRKVLYNTFSTVTKGKKKPALLFSPEGIIL